MPHSFQEVIDDLDACRDMLSSGTTYQYCQSLLENLDSAQSLLKSLGHTHCERVTYEIEAAVKIIEETLYSIFPAYVSSSHDLESSIRGNPTSKFAYAETLISLQSQLDPEGTTRDKNGRLHGPDGRFIKDLTRVFQCITYRAKIAKKWDHTTESHKHWISKVISDKNDAWEKVAAIGEALLYSSQKNHDDSTTSYSQLSEKAKQYVTLLNESAKLFSMKQYWMWHTVLAMICEAQPKAIRLSERCGEVAGSIYSSDTGHATIVGIKTSDDKLASPTGPGKFDQISISSDQNKLIVIENKGGDNPQYGSRVIATGERAEQGSLEYLTDLLTGVNQDQRLPSAFEKLSKDERYKTFCDNLKNGRIEIEYLSANMDSHGAIHMAKYDLGAIIKLQGEIKQFQNVRIINDKRTNK